MNKRLWILNILLMMTLSMSLRIYLISLNGPAYGGDSREYLEVIRNISDGYGFKRLDIVSGKFEPYANKPPLFFYVSYLFAKITHSDPELAIVILNIISSLIIIVLSIKISMLISGDRYFSLLTGYLIVLNSNIISNSLFLMSDTFYLLILTIFQVFMIKAILNRKNYLFLIAGALMGLTVLTRTVLKAYWIFIIIYIAIFIKEEIRKRIKYIVFFISAYAFIIIPYHIRNYIQLHSPSPLELHQGIAVSWIILPLIKDVDYSKLEEKYPKMKDLISIIKDKEMPPEYEIRTRLKMNPLETSKYLTELAIYTIIKKPGEYIKLYIKNFINILTSSSSYLIIIDVIKPGYYDTQHKKFISFIKNKLKPQTLKDFIYYNFPNIFFRILNLVIILIAILEMMKAITSDNLLKPIHIYFLFFFVYSMLVSSLALGYDRYRLVIEFIISFYFAKWLYGDHLRNFLKA